MHHPSKGRIHAHQRKIRHGKHRQHQAIPHQAKGTYPFLHPGASGAFFTSKDIVNALADQGTKVGTATVYRNLERLEEEGIIARTSIEGTSSICYRFLPDAPEDVYFFLKCEECGNLSPIDCGELQKLYEHVIEHHHVRINPTKTVLYGLCEACLAKRGE